MPTRREALSWLGAGAILVGCQGARSGPRREAITNIRPLGPGVEPWWTPDPFLFCVHHDDQYPMANGAYGPAASLQGHARGSDFAGVDGWRMYHGEAVPGFPVHPHRGFETVTVVRRGLLDHSDSLGAQARYGRGDVQWLTAGRGIQHAEMFPLLDTRAENRVELFQIWLNLPGVNKLVAPYFSMLWQPAMPHHVLAGGQVEVTTIAGALDDRRTAPPPESWAANADHGVAIWTIKLAPNTTWVLPAARAGLNRVLYYFDGDKLALDSRAIPARSAVELVSDADVAIEAGPRGAELLMLQGQPIGEPVVQRGPFVMNTREEIAQTIEEYRATQFGGWRWPSPEPVHGAEGRFARHADGRLDKPA